MTDSGDAATVDVAVVGGGPAGAATAIRLARRGYSVALFERHASPRWRACGVFASPLVRHDLEAVGIASDQLASLARPIAAMLLASTHGATCRLEYGHGFACGFDRVSLDARLLDLASAAGADVRRGTVVREVALDRRLPIIDYSDVVPDREEAKHLTARIVVGAEGGGSRVAHAAGVSSERNLLRRSAITFHVSDPDPLPEDKPATARFVLGDGSYVGLAPVPGGRVNVGIVVPTARLHGGVEQAIASLVAGEMAGAKRWMSDARTDDAQVCGRLEHHVTRVAGDTWLLVGDAAGFIDPLTGEGLHRALVTAAFAAEAIHRRLSGDRAALAVYDRRVRSRFRSKNVFSLVLQAFISNPRVLDYALDRLARRESLREQLTAVLTDESKASRALDPRFIARLLAP